jgi:acyl-coenzyme A synthetase/AMP-(fatty) acid ligase
MQFGTSECLEHWARYHPSKTAVWFNGKGVSYRDFSLLVDRIAARVIEIPTTSGRIAIAANSKISTLLAIYGTIRAGKSAVLLNVGLSTETLRTNIMDASVDGILAASDCLSLVELLPARSPIYSIDELIAADEHSVPKKESWPLRQGHQEWGVFFSSGTTGIPKAIERSHHSVVTELLGWVIELQLNRSTSFYIGRPIYYTGGAVLALSVLLTGGSLILNDYDRDLDFHQIWRDYQAACQRMAIDWAFFIPDQIRAFLTEAGANKPVNAARTLLLMGAPISGDEKVHARNVLGSGIVESWGNSESLGTITEPEDVIIRPNSIGRPFLSDYMCVVDETGQPVGEGELGRLSGGVEAGFEKYANRPRDTDRAKQGGLIVSEDIGYVDRDGYFYVKGRVQESVVVGTKTYFVTELEAAVREIRGVKECIVAAKPGDIVAFGAILALSDGVEELGVRRNVQQALKDAIGSSDVVIHDPLIVEAIPRLPSGKVDRLRSFETIFDSQVPEPT